MLRHEKNNRNGNLVCFFELFCASVSTLFFGYSKVFFFFILNPKPYKKGFFFLPAFVDLTKGRTHQVSMFFGYIAVPKSSSPPKTKYIGIYTCSSWDYKTFFSFFSFCFWEKETNHFGASRSDGKRLGKHLWQPGWKKKRKRCAFFF